MVAGLSVTFYYMATTQPWLRSVFGVKSPIADNIWWGIQPISAGLWGVPLGFAVIIIVSLLTPKPEKEVQDLVEHVRYPNLEGDAAFQANLNRPRGKLAPAV
jgi:cation/acetate symporter